MENPTGQLIMEWKFCDKILWQGFPHLRSVLSRKMFCMRGFYCSNWLFLSIWSHFVLHAWKMSLAELDWVGGMSWIWRNTDPTVKVEVLRLQPHSSSSTLFMANAIHSFQPFTATCAHTSDVNSCYLGLKRLISTSMFLCKFQRKEHAYLTWSA